MFSSGGWGVIYESNPHYNDQLFEVKHFGNNVVEIIAHDGRIFTMINDELCGWMNRTAILQRWTLIEIRQ